METTWQQLLITALQKCYPDKSKSRQQLIAAKVKEPNIKLDILLNQVVEQTSTPKQRLGKKLILIEEIGSILLLRTHFKQYLYRYWIVAIIRKHLQLGEMNVQIQYQFKKGVKDIERRRDCVLQMIQSIKKLITSPEKLPSALNTQKFVEELKKKQLYTHYLGEIGQKTLQAMANRQDGMKVQSKDQDAQLTKVKEPQMIDQKGGLLGQKRIRENDLKSAQKKVCNIASNKTVEVKSKFDIDKRQIKVLPKRSPTLLNEQAPITKQGVADHCQDDQESHTSQAKDRQQMGRKRNNIKIVGRPNCQPIQTNIRQQNLNEESREAKKAKKNQSLEEEELTQQIRLKIYRQITYTFNNIIAKNQNEPKKIQKEIIGYLNDKCSYGNRRKIRTQMKWLLQQFFRITCKEFCCGIQAQQIVLKNAIGNYNKYRKMQTLIQQYHQQRISSFELIKELIEIIRERNSRIYWLTFDDKSLFIVLIEAHIRQKLNDELIRILKDSDKALNIDYCKIVSEFGSLGSQTLLIRILLDDSLQGINPSVLEVIAEQAAKQGIDIIKLIPGYSKSLIDLFQQRGLSEDRLFDIIEKKKRDAISNTMYNSGNQFEIYDISSKQIIPLKVSMQIQGKLCSFLFDNEEHINVLINDIENDLKITIYREDFLCTWSNQHGQKSGFVRYLGKVPKKKVSWVLIEDKTWNRTPLSQKESDTLSTILQHTDVHERFNINIDSINQSVSINPRTLSVKRVVGQGGSKILIQCGFLYWLPSYKESQTSNKMLQEWGKQILGTKPTEQDELENDEGQDIFNDAEDLNPIYQIKLEQRQFPNLGLFYRDLNFPNEEYQILGKNIVTSNANVIQYLETFAGQQIYTSLAAKLSKPLEKSFKKGLEADACLQEWIREDIKTAEDKTSMMGSFTLSSMEDKIRIQVYMLSKDQDDKRFVNLFLQYIVRNAEDKNKCKFLKAELNEGTIEIIKALDPHQRYAQIQQLPKKIDNKRNKLVQMRIQPQFMEAVTRMEDQKFEFEVLGVRALQYMRQEEPDAQSRLGLSISIIDCEKFRVKCLPKSFIKFQEKFNKYSMKIRENEEKETLTKDLPGQSEHYQIYKDALSGIPGINVFKMLGELRVSYLKKHEKEVLQKIQQCKYKVQSDKLIKARNSKSEFIIQGVSLQFLLVLKQIVSAYHNKKSQQEKLSAYVELTKDEQRQKYIITLKNCLNPSQTDQFQQQILNFEKRTQQFQKIRANLGNYQYMIQRELQLLKNGIHNQKAQKHFVGICQKYKNHLKSLLEKIKQDAQLEVNQKFIVYLKEQNDLTFRKKFSYDAHKPMNDKITQQIKKMTLFADLFVEIMKEKQQQCYSEFKSALSSQERVKHETFIRSILQSNFTKMDENFRSGSFNINYFADSVKSLEIAVKTLFGPKLPIVPHLEQFKDKMDKNNIIVVKTGTGSGKSTVLPVFLLSLGYKNVLVTQPRRLACREIYKRVKSIYGNDVVGYKVAGENQSTKNSLLYMTDGLIKETFYSERFNKEKFEKIDVIMLDEVHERSKNIQFLLLFLSRVMQANSKLKVILCSATVDESIIDLFDKNLKHGVFEVDVRRHPVTQHPIKSGSILDKALELSSQLKSTEQMLVFLPSVDDAEKAKQNFYDKKKRLAYVLHGAQGVKDQDMALQSGQIFFATSIAETSLTFKNLKYVIDSQKSRVQKFDPQKELVCTEQIPSSESSTKQRKGRLGRTTSGQYHYMVYQNSPPIRPYDLTEIQKIDVTNVIFELLLKYKDYKLSISELERLNYKKDTDFSQKIKYSEKKFNNFQLLKKNNLRIDLLEKFIKYGNLGSYTHNYALLEAENNGCSKNLIAIVSFYMYGRGITNSMIAGIPKHMQYESGDIETIQRFLIDIATSISLETLTFDQIKTALQASHPDLARKAWSSTLFKIIKQMWKLYRSCDNLSDCRDWNTILSILVNKPYQSSIYISNYMLGGSKRFYDKLIPDKLYKMGERIVDAQVYYYLDRESLASPRNFTDIPPAFVLSMFANINPYAECTLSFNSKIPYEILQGNINIEMKKHLAGQGLAQAHNIDEENIFTEMAGQVISLHEAACTYLNDLLHIKGEKRKIVPRIKHLEQKRRALKVTIDLKAQLNKALQERKNRQDRNSTLKPVDPQLLKDIFSTLQLPQLFLTLKFDLQNNYNSDLMFHYNGTMDIINTKNEVTNRVMNKIKGFFTWYVFCQNICTDDLKEPVRQPYSDKLESKQVANQIYKRINEIVDPDINIHTLRNMANGQLNDRCQRTARMVAVCWILTNHFDCIVKGGFIRDWVVRGEQCMPKGDLTNLLKVSPVNGYLQVDDSVTPSDLDVEMSKKKVFDEQKFRKMVEKIGIKCEFHQDNWRRQIVFDKNAPSGGFTADLLQPYTHICYDTYDFDVNTFYLKAGHLNQLGMKIKLKLTKIEAGGRKNEQVTMEQLIHSCRQKKMRVIKPGIPSDRLTKFRKRGWDIDPAIYDPVVYNNNRGTTSYLEDMERFRQLCPNYETELNGKVLRVQALKNCAWDEAYRATLDWILKQHNTTNERLLYHGTKQDGMKGILISGFDSRYFAKGGYYGRGAYFADVPTKSNQYTSANAKGERKMFICQVALGNQQTLNAADNNRTGPDKGYHSIYGLAGHHRQYIIDRWGQSIPIYLVTYKSN